MKNFRRQLRPKKNSLVIGAEAVKKAMELGQPLDLIYIQHSTQGKQIEEIKILARQSHVPVHKVPVEKLNGLNIVGHGGVVARIARVQYHDLQEIISFVVENGQSPLLLILDGVTDVRNIGGLARTAFCCGVNALIIPEKGVGALNEDAIFTSAGALEKIPVCRVTSLMKAVDELHLNGIKVFATDADGAIPVFEGDFTGPCAIIMGSEDKGVYPALAKICDERIKIPMTGNFESLNVGVAAGIILYEAMKQRIKHS